MKRLAVLGGTFDPPHNGHMSLAREAVSKNLCDRLLLLVSYLPPHKQERSVTPFEDRLAMTRLAAENIPSVEVSDLEGQWKLNPSYTFNVLQHLKQVYPNWQLCYLIGADSLRQLHTWYRAEELVATTNFIACPRPGENLSLQELAQHWPQKTAEKLFFGITDLSFVPVSSSEIRLNVAAGKDVSGFIPEKVADFIRTKKLYGTL